MPSAAPVLKSGLTRANYGAETPGHPLPHHVEMKPEVACHPSLRNTSAYQPHRFELELLRIGSSLPLLPLLHETPPGSSSHLKKVSGKSREAHFGADAMSQRGPLAAFRGYDRCRPILLKNSICGAGPKF